MWWKEECDEARLLNCPGTEAKNNVSIFYNLQEVEAMKKFLNLMFLCGLNVYTHSSQSYDHLPWDNLGFHGHELALVEKFLPPNPVILEAGAHHGEDTVIFVQRWPKAKIYAFEPCPQYYKKLEQATRGYNNIHIFPFGLFSKTGAYSFQASNNWDGASSLFEDNHLSFGLDYDDQQIEVYCKNLDEWAEENNVTNIDYMWLDMEGAEGYVLKSAPKIMRTVRAISCELNFWEYRKGMTLFQDIYDFLTKEGFTLYKIWGSPQGQATGVFIRKD